jgi:hypothetical protein
MKTVKITYWISTSLMSLLMVFSAYSYLTQDKIAQAFHHLGFPDYFRVELAIAKLISAIVLLAPAPAKIKEWAYAGLGITFISAFIAHSASGDPVSVAIMPLIIMVILVVSYVSWGKKGAVTTA